ncbi:DVU_1556 family methyltransferase [Citrifermentans pelophilum]|uniref:DVU_1556 family methyltransferase n=1 Tax=Geoanaerobacter pelophilus TaxID=60036 RepID=UPI001F3DAFBA|nr:class I SAM-dependent methyltransferase [Geoanaerobacter pelophilus]
MMHDAAFDWKEIHDAVGQCLRPGGPLLTDRALEVCNLPAGSVVADIGCGAGETLQHLERSRLFRLVGVDASLTLLAVAATRLETARLVYGRAEKLPFEKESIEALFCECVLSIVGDKQAALDEFARVVKDGGFLVLSDVFKKAGGGEAGGLLSRAELIDSLSRRGFTVLLWEVHDRLLKEFAVRMIFAGKSLPQLWGCGQEKKEVRNKGISYYLLVAGKVGASFDAAGNGTEGPS